MASTESTTSAADAAVLVVPAELPPVELALGELLRRAANQWPDTDAVVYPARPGFEETRWSFAELDERAQGLAAGLARRYAPGEHIAVWGPNVPEWILLEWAVARAGLTLVALNPLYKERELEFALRVTGTTAIFLLDELKGIDLHAVINRIRPNLSTLRDVFSLVGDLPRLSEDGPVDRAVDPGATMMIQFTSGTTGVPKAARLTHRGLATTGRDLLLRLGVRPGDKVAHGFPLFHVGGSGVLTPASATIGYTTLPLVIFEAGLALDILESERCVGFLGVPTMLLAMIEHPSISQRDLSALRFVVAGGAVMPEPLVNRIQQILGAEVVNVYGQTESSGVTSSALLDDEVALKALTVGRPLPGTSVKIVDPAGATLARGQAGELCYRGIGLMPGYLNEEPGTAAVDGDGWLHTGDVAVMTEQGNLRITGRVKEMVIRGGENLSPSEIEAVLLEHPTVAEVAVIGVPDLRYGEELCAVVRRSGDADGEAIRSFCAERLSRWKVPRYVEFVDEFPLTPAGKVRKFLLTEQMIRRLGLDQQDWQGATT